MDIAAHHGETVIVVKTEGEQKDKTYLAVWPDVEDKNDVVVARATHKSWHEDLNLLFETLESADIDYFMTRNGLTIHIPKGSKFPYLHGRTFTGVNPSGVFRMLSKTILDEFAGNERHETVEALARICSPLSEVFDEND